MDFIQLGVFKNPPKSIKHNKVTSNYDTCETNNLGINRFFKNST